MAIPVMPYDLSVLFGNQIKYSTGFYLRALMFQYMLYNRHRRKIH